MRRCLVTATLVAALAMPAAALAGTRHFDGSVDPSGGISFDAKTRSGKVVKVLPGLAFDKVPVTCDSGKRTFTGNFDFGMAVRIGQFKGTGLYDPSGGVKVAGEFTHHGRRANGIIRISGDFDLGNGVTRTNCHGSHQWHAHAT